MKKAGIATAIVLACAAVPSVAKAVASAELYKTQAYTYGRFEARIRFGAGDGIISSFFLWKEGSEVANAFWNELDFEKLGADCHMQTNAIYGSPSAEHPQTNKMPGDICSEYHDYRFEWTPTYIAWAVDGQEIRRETGATATAFSQNASGGMTFHFNIWPGNANFGGNFNPSSLPVREHISWVSYSSHNNGSFKQEWREDFTGASLPSGWATGDWASPYKLSTHNPSNVTFTGGMATLSLTADNALGFSGTPPADNGSSGGAASGGSGNGGASTGGTSNRGGSATANGGSANGGTANGGATTVSRGGAATGGASASRGGSSAASSSGVTTGAGGTSTSSSRRQTNAGGKTTQEESSVGGEADSRGGSSSKAQVGGATSTRRSSTDDQAEGGSESGQTGKASSKSGGTGTKQAATGGESASKSHASNTPENTMASNDQPGNDGCSCRVGDSRNPNSPIGLKLLGLMVLFGAARGRRLTRSRQSQRT